MTPFQRLTNVNVTSGRSIDVETTFKRCYVSTDLKPEAINLVIYFERLSTLCEMKEPIKHLFQNNTFNGFNESLIAGFHDRR